MTLNLTKSNTTGKLLLIAIVMFFSSNLFSQSSWSDLKNDKNAKFEDIQEAFHQEWDGREYQRGQGYKQFYRWENFWEDRLMPDGSFPDFSIAYKEYKDYMKSHGGTNKSANSMLGNWLPLGPFDFTTTGSWSSGTGRVNVVVQDPNNANIIYIGAPAGGIWKSIDAGSNWTPLGDDFSVIGISGIAVDPSNSNILYVATGDSDAGDTYDIGIFKSTDGGLTWAQAGTNFGQCNKILIDPNTTSTVWASGDNGLYKSTNSGASWTQMLSGNIKDMALKPGDPQTVYGVSSTNFYYSTNGGTSFSTATGMPGGTTRLVIGVTPANSSYVYVVAANGSWGYQGVYRSTDSGVSFTARNTTTDIFDGSGQAWYDMAVTVSDTDPNTLIFGVLNLWRSTDGGTSWSGINSWSNPSGASYTHADIHYLNYYNGNLYCGSDGGVYKSTDNGNNFTDLTHGVQIGQFYTIASSPNDPNVLAGGLQDNGGYAWTSGSWKVYYGADGMGSAINHSNSNNIFGMIQFGGLYYTTNGGFNLSAVGTGGGQGGAWVTPMEWDESNNRIVAGYDDVFEFNNTTLSWNQLSTFSFPSKLQLIEVYEGNATTFIAGTSNSIYKTTDNGANFSNITGSLPGSITSVEFNPTNDNELWVTIGGWTNGSKVFHTTNSGGTWTNISGSLPNLPTNIIRYDATNDGHYIGMDIGVYYRDDILGDWIPFNDNLPNVIVNDIEINETNNLVRIGTYGRGVWESGTYNVPVVSNNVSLNIIMSPQGSSCSTDIVPEIEVRNVGDNVISSFDVEYDVDGGGTLTYSWAGSLTTGSAVTITLPLMTVSYGTHVFNVLLTNPNGTVDGDTANNVGSSIFEAINGSTVTLSIDTDCWGNETSWILQDNGGNIIDQISAGSLGSQQNYTWDFCLATGCYDITINDTYGDGLNGTAYGCAVDGNYSLYDGFGNTHVQMGAPDFGFGISHNFCHPVGILGCMDTNACNYDSTATVDDGSCTYPGCTNATACNYNASAGCDNGSCILPDGCTDFLACNYNALALCDDGSCDYTSCLGCLDTNACNFDSTATQDDGSCTYPGCTNATACNYNASAGCDNGSCILPDGCTDSSACNYNALALCDDGSCDYTSCLGCTNNTACNFDSTSTQDDGSCILPDGCTDSLACNYSASALCDDGTCDYSCYGCMDSTACNYDSMATLDDGSCDFTSCLCMGDLNNDGFINVQDLLAMLADYGCTGTCSGDLNNDLIVNSSDLLVFLSVFGQPCN